MSNYTRQKKDDGNKDKQNKRAEDARENGHAHLDAQTGHKNEGPLDHLNRADFDRDLRPHEFDGNNDRPDDESATDGFAKAHDFKEIIANYPELNSAQLKGLAILPAGTRLEQGATYYDLAAPDAGEFKARGDQIVEEGQRIIAKRSVDFEVWNILREHTAKNL